MDNYANFDEGYVKFTTGCSAYDNPLVATDGGSASVIPNVLNLNNLPRDIFPPVPNGEHNQCYMLEKADNIKAEEIMIQDQFSKSRVVLGRPVMICNPSLKIHNKATFKIQDEKRHLVCYNYIKQGRGDSQQLRISTQFGKDEVVATLRELFCAPAGKNHIK